MNDTEPPFAIGPHWGIGPTCPYCGIKVSPGARIFLCTRAPFARNVTVSEDDLYAYVMLIETGIALERKCGMVQYA